MIAMKNVALSGGRLWQLEDHECHAGGSRIPVKCVGVLTLGGRARALDPAISEAGTAGAEIPQCLRADFCSLNHKF